MLSSAFIFYININTLNKYFIDFTFEKIKNFIVLFFFIVLSLCFYYNNPKSDFMNYFGIIVYILIFTTGLYLMFLLLFYFNSFTDSIIDNSNSNSKLQNFITNLSRVSNLMRLFFILTMFICLFTIITLFGSNITSSFSSSDSTKLFINIITIIIIAAFVFKFISYSNIYQDSPLLQLIINIIFYIPCILVSFVDNFVKITGIDVKGNKDLFKSSSTDYILLIIAILLNAGYFIYPHIAGKFAKQGGTMLVDNPVYTNTKKELASYFTLNKSEDFNYNYAISFWVYLDAANPSTSIAYTKYTSLLNYGGKPNILYRGMDNTIIITMDIADFDTQINSELKNVKLQVEFIKAEYKIIEASEEKNLNNNFSLLPATINIIQKIISVLEDFNNIVIKIQYIIANTNISNNLKNDINTMQNNQIQFNKEYLQVANEKSKDKKINASFLNAINISNNTVISNVSKYIRTIETLLINTKNNKLADRTDTDNAIKRNSTDLYDLDKNGNAIICTINSVLLQKWNNIIINYTGGTLDVFYNGELIKSVIGIIPYMKYDKLTIGSNNGIRGGICSVNYFNSSLNVQQIYHLYNFLKDNTPPVYKSSQETISNVVNDIPNNITEQNINNYTNTIKYKFKNV